MPRAARAVRRNTVNSGCRAWRLVCACIALALLLLVSCAVAGEALELRVTPGTLSARAIAASGPLAADSDAAIAARTVRISVVSPPPSATAAALSIPLMRTDGSPVVGNVTRARFDDGRSGRFAVPQGNGTTDDGAHDALAAHVWQHTRVTTSARAVASYVASIIGGASVGGRRMFARVTAAAIEITLPYDRRYFAARDVQITFHFAPDLFLVDATVPPPAAPPAVLMPAHSTVATLVIAATEDVRPLPPPPPLVTTAYYAALAASALAAVAAPLVDGSGGGGLFLTSQFGRSNALARQAACAFDADSVAAHPPRAEAPFARRLPVLLHQRPNRSTAEVADNWAASAGGGEGGSSWAGKVAGPDEAVGAVLGQAALNAAAVLACGAASVLLSNALGFCVAPRPAAHLRTLVLAATGPRGALRVLPHDHPTAVRAQRGWRHRLACFRCPALAIGLAWLYLPTILSGAFAVFAHTARGGFAVVLAFALVLLCAVGTATCFAVAVWFNGAELRTWPPAELRSPFFQGGGEWVNAGAPKPAAPGGDGAAAGAGGGGGGGYANKSGASVSAGLPPPLLRETHFGATLRLSGGSNAAFGEEKGMEEAAEEEVGVDRLAAARLLHEVTANNRNVGFLQRVGAPLVQPFAARRTWFLGIEFVVVYAVAAVDIWWPQGGDCTPPRLVLVIVLAVYSLGTLAARPYATPWLLASSAAITLIQLLAAALLLAAAFHGAQSPAVPPSDARAALLAAAEYARVAASVLALCRAVVDVTAPTIVARMKPLAQRGAAPDHRSIAEKYYAAAVAPALAQLQREANDARRADIAAWLCEGQRPPSPTPTSPEAAEMGQPLLRPSWWGPEEERDPGGIGGVAVNGNESVAAVASEGVADAALPSEENDEEGWWGADSANRHHDRHRHRHRHRHHDRQPPTDAANPPPPTHRSHGHSRSRSARRSETPRMSQGGGGNRSSAGDICRAAHHDYHQRTHRRRRSAGREGRPLGARDDADFLEYQRRLAVL